MVDVEKLQRFKNRFNDWRGPVVSAAEETLLTTVTAISSYVDGVSDVRTLQHDLVAGSPVYEQIVRLFHGRTYGALLYGKLAIEDYYLQCAENNRFADHEEVPLALLVSTLRSLYESPHNNTARRLQQLLTQTHAWLVSLELNNENIALAKTTLLSLYTMLMLVDTKLAHLTLAEKTGLTLLSINRTRARQDVGMLLNKTAERLTELERNLAQPARVEENEPHPVPRTFNQFIDAQCLNLLEQQGPTLAEKIAQVRTWLADVRTNLTALLAEKTQAVDLHQQLKHAITMLLAINTNEQQIIGKQYATELINKNRASFNNLLAHATTQEQQGWERRLERLEHPGLLQQATKVSQYALSWATLLPTLAYRTFAPKSFVSWVSDHSFSTFDSECKLRLKALAEARVSSLHDALTASATIKERLADLLVANDPTVKPQILAASTAKLSEILATTNEIYQVITDYEALSIHIMHNQEKLQEIRGLNETVDSFITMHDGFFVKLSLFLAKIHSLFKTDTAAKVEEVHTIKAALQHLKNQYELAVTDGMEEISQSPVLSPPLKEAVVAKLTPAPSPEPEAPHLPRNIITAFNLVKTTFNRHIAHPEDSIPMVDENSSRGAPSARSA